MSRSDNLRTYRERVVARMEARREDLLWMVETGESLIGAAERLGIKVDALEKWCLIHDLRDELARLRSRDPSDPFFADRARAAAAARWSA